MITEVNRDKFAKASHVLCKIGTGLLTTFIVIAILAHMYPSVLTLPKFLASLTFL